MSAAVIASSFKGVFELNQQLYLRTKLYCNQRNNYYFKFQLFAW